MPDAFGLTQLKTYTDTSLYAYFRGAESERVYREGWVYLRIKKRNSEGTDFFQGNYVGLKECYNKLKDEKIV